MSDWRKHIQVNRTDSLTLQRIKVCILLPISLLLYLPIALWVGIKEAGNPFDEAKEIWRGDYK